MRDDSPAIGGAASPQEGAATGPLSFGGRSARAPMIDPSLDEARAPTILVCDHMEANRRVLATWLAGAGYVVAEASTGAEALAGVSESDVDLALVDVDLPEGGGLETGRALKASQPSDMIPVILLSATHVDPADRSLGLRSGADGYLVEPVTRDELLASVEAVLRYSGARRRAERLASRLELLNLTTLEISRARSFPEVVRVCAQQCAAVFEARTVVVALGEGRSVVARADVPTGWQLDELAASPSMLDEDRLATSDEPYTVPAFDRPDPVVGFDLGRTYRAVAVHVHQGGGRSVVGVELAAGDPETVGEIDLVLRQVARALGVAFANLHALRVERSLALQLQHSLLPSALPVIEGLELAARYVASTEHAEVGGDFFEVIELGRGRVGIAIGDVQGHSLDAAAVMAGLRHWVQAYALEGHSPARVLQRVNALLIRSHPSLIATACYGELTLGSGRLRVANAGHVPPLVVGPAGVGYLPVRGLLLGVDGPPLAESEVTLEVDDTVLWVTDGLIERRDEPLEAGLDRLLQAAAWPSRHGSPRAFPPAFPDGAGRPTDDLPAPDLAGAPESLEDLCSRLLGLVGPGPADDVALVACRLLAPPVAGESTPHPSWPAS